jgi:Rab3 GTPase-activating protein catalytic subunit
MRERAADELIAIHERLGDSEVAQQVRARHQSAQLRADMQAFKAANPGCVLEDFVRWHSPRDWIEEGLEEGLEEEDAGGGGEGMRGAGRAACGQLSARFHEPNNLWCQLWGATLPLAASQQKPLFDPAREAAEEQARERAAADAAASARSERSGIPSSWGWGASLAKSVASAATGLVAESVS